MSFVTSESTDAEVSAARQDNADYDISGSVAKVKNFIVATRVYLTRCADEVSKGGVTVQEQYQKIQGELAKAEAWWRANDTSASTPQYRGGTRLLGVAAEGWRT